MVFFFISMVLSIGVVYSRGDRPGITIDVVQQITPQGRIDRVIPFSFTEAELQQGILTLDVPLEGVSEFTSPALAIMRPLYFVEVIGDGALMSPPLEQKIGRDVLLLPLSPEVQSLQVRVEGDYGKGGLDDVLVLGNYGELTQYFRVRSMTSVFLLTILLSTAISMFMLVLFRPLQETFLSVGAFAMALAFNVIGNADVWFVLSNSVEWQLRFKGLSVATSIGLSFYMLSTFTHFSNAWSRKAVIAFLTLGTGCLWLPSLEQVNQLRSLLDLISIPFILMTLGLFLGNLRSATRELRYYYGTAMVLIIGGILDLMALYDLHYLPPMMPVASVLFMVGITMYFVIDSSNFSERYRTVVNESQDGIVIVDRHSQVVDSNNLAESWGLHTTTTLLSMLDVLDIEWGSLLNGPMQFSWDLDIAGIVVECHSTPLEQERALLVFRDVTEQRLKAQQEVERVRLETVERVSGGVAHDFNNLFMALHGQMALLAEEGPSEVAFRIQKMEALLSNGSHSIERLQSFIRGEVSSVEKRLLQDWLQDIKPLVQGVLPEDTKIHWNIPTVQIMVDISSKELEQVLVNLLFNAKDALSQGFNQKSLWIDVNFQENKHWVDIAIEDSGFGIPEAERQTIFQPFVSTKSSNVGHGLGLSIVQEGMTQMGGTVRVEDPQHQQGARFVLRLPCKVLPEDSVVQNQPNIDQHSILVLEDELLIREVLETFLQRGGYQVYAAATVEEAVSILEAYPIHCIVSDVLLGSRAKDNGILFCKQAVDAGYRNPIVIVSGYIPERDETMGVSWHFMAKPFRYAELLELLGDILQRDVVANSPVQIVGSSFFSR